jgi:acetoin utilization protein AcuB
MRLKAVMTAPIGSISPCASISTAARRLRTNGIHHLVVIDHGKIVGLVTADTLTSRQAEGATRVENAMLRNITIATPEMTVREAADLMMPGHPQTAIPVVSKGRLIGIVTVSDLLRLAGRVQRVPEAPSVAK